jgi:hypothetical protein
MLAHQSVIELIYYLCGWLWSTSCCQNVWYIMYLVVIHILRIGHRIEPRGLWCQSTWLLVLLRDEVMQSVFYFLCIFKALVLTRHISHIGSQDNWVYGVKIWRCIPWIVNSRFCNNWGRAGIIKRSITALETTCCLWCYNWWCKIERRLGYTFYCTYMMKPHPIIHSFLHVAWTRRGRN